jgi:hypothetical protein
MEDYEFKYVGKPKANKQRKGDGIKGRLSNPDLWCTGPDPLRHEIYYAYLKHQAQARFRKEDYTLTFEDWESLWTTERWLQRGRKIDNLCLQQKEPGDGWHLNNVEVVTRRKHFADIKKRNADARSKL